MSVAIVTGASRGLGLALTRELHARGWTVVVDAREPAPLAEATDGLERVVALPGDVGDPGHRADLVRAAGAPVHVLVNNAAGVSSLECDEGPYAERYDVPGETARLVNAARRRGGRIIAVGTTVVRALESCARPDGTVEAGAGWTELVVTPARGVWCVDGLLTGWHDPRSSHLWMLETVAGRVLLERSYLEAQAHGFSGHEFGDMYLVLP